MPLTQSKKRRKGGNKFSLQNFIISKEFFFLSGKGNIFHIFHINKNNNNKDDDDKNSFQ